MEGSVSPQNLVQPTPGLPLILDGNFFKVIAEEGLKVTGQCTLCPSRIMGLKTTTSNFNTHLKKMHPDRHRIYEEYKIERGQTIKKRRTSHDFPRGTFLNPNAKRRPSNDNGLSSNQEGLPDRAGHGYPMEGFRQKLHPQSIPKRRQNNLAALTNSEMRPAVASRRPNTVQGSVSAALLPPTIKARRKETDDVVFNFIIKSLSPTSLVESPHFISLVSGLCSSPRRVMSRNTLESRISMQSLVKRTEIARNLSKTEFICLTADAWAVTTESTNTFVAMTAHSIGSSSLKVQSSLLSCRRFQQDLTYEKLVEVIYEVLGIYGIPIEKICCIVTNNASNLLPTRIYQIQHSEDEENMSTNQDCPSIDNCDNVSNEDLSFYNISSIIANSVTADTTNQLPSHYDCPTQTLIGVLATSTFETLSNPDRPTSYIFQSAIAKCQGLWKACSNKEAGERIQDLYGLEILIPNRLNWGSFLEGIDCLLSGKDVLEGIFMFFDLPALENTEVEFLEEYAKTMEPITDALAVLQDENDLYMGSFVPTIISLKEKLEELNLEGLKYTKPLAKNLLTGLDGPFMDIITLSSRARPLILASILHPLYKLSWIPMDKIGELKGWYMEEIAKFGSVLENDAPKSHDASKKETQIDTLENDLFGFSSGGEENGKGDVSSVLMEFLGYLEAPVEPVDGGQLDRFPNVKKLFITFNTAIASSVPVERIINFSEVSFAPSRAILKDELLENMMILKSN